MSKALILSLLTATFAVIITILGSKDEITWPLRNITLRGWGILFSCLMSIILGYFSYRAGLKEGKLALTHTPYIEVFQNNDIVQMLDVPINNQGNDAINNISCKVDFYQIDENLKLKFLKTSETPVSDIPDDSYVSHRIKVDNIVFAQCMGSAMLIDVNIKAESNNQQIRKLFLWSFRSPNMFALISDVGINNDYLNQIIEIKKLR